MRRRRFELCNRFKSGKKLYNLDTNNRTDSGTFTGCAQYVVKVVDEDDLVFNFESLESAGKFLNYERFLKFVLDVLTVFKENTNEDKKLDLFFNGKFKKKKKIANLPSFKMFQEHPFLEKCTVEVYVSDGRRHVSRTYAKLYENQKYTTFLLMKKKSFFKTHKQR